MQRYARLLGRRAFKWHGDVTARARRRFVADPADILLTTPEALEAMMMGTSVPAQALFANLRAVVVDEVHVFARDDRGAHLSAVLERLVRFSGRDLQRIGLRMLEAELGEGCTSRNLSLTLREDAGKSVVALRQAIGRLAESGRPSDEDALNHAEGAARGRVSKFQGCLPEALLQDLLARALLDARGARMAVALGGGALA